VTTPNFDGFLGSEFPSRRHDIVLALSQRTVGTDIAGFYTDLILVNEATNYGPRRT